MRNNFDKNVKYFMEDKGRRMHIPLQTIFFLKLGTLQLNKCIADFKKRGLNRKLFYDLWQSHLKRLRFIWNTIELNLIYRGKHLHRLYFFSLLPPSWAFGVEINFCSCSDWYSPNVSTTPGFFDNVYLSAGEH